MSTISAPKVPVLNSLQLREIATILDVPGRSRADKMGLIRLINLNYPSLKTTSQTNFNTALESLLGPLQAIV